MTIENTELSQKIHGIFEASLKSKAAKKKQAVAAHKAANKPKKKKGAPPPSPPPPPPPHADENAPLEGVLGKGDNYARRGFEYLKGLDGRGVYRNFNFPHLDDIREAVRERAEFPGGPVENFDPDPNQQRPYNWEAHHMLPGSAFYYELDGKLVFSYKALRLILQSKYNLNHGHNMIFLPDEDWACPVHTLICHPSDHRTWTTKIMKDLKQIADDLQKKIDALQPHEALSADVFEQLKACEESAWKFIVKLSRVAIPMAVRGIHFTDFRLKWETKEGKKYDFPALA